MGKQSLPHSPRTKYDARGIALLLLCLLSLPRLSAQTASVSALTVPLILPSAIVFDATGNLYFAETGNHVIRKVDTVGNITTIAGTGTQGFSGDLGLATSATLDSPQGLALDTARNLYIADTHNQRIRKLNLTTGVITTIAGSTSGFSGDGASALSAQLSLPTALALDSSGNLYIADTGNHRIRKLNLATAITTIAGNGTQGYSGDLGAATSAAIDSPTGIALDASSNLYLADTHNHRVREINANTGVITTIAGTGSPGFSGDTTAATAANLALPHGLTSDSAGNLYLADTANHRIRRIDATTGIITTVVGDGTQTFAGDNGPPTAASLDSPTATTLSPASNLTLSDTGNQRIRQVVTQTTPTSITTVAGLGLTAPGVLNLTAPYVIAYGTGQLTATLATSPATGTVTFFETVNTTTKILGSSPVVSNTATLSTTTLAAGAYNLTATYSGDQTHPSAQSPALALTITPLQLTATIAPISLLYGQAIPNLSGTLTGVLPQDAANLTATFITTATVGSSAGTYSVTPVLNGSAAGNYTVAASPAAITIHPAPTVITLSNLVATGTTGSTVTLTVHVASTTTGTPPGSVTLLDGNSPLSTTPLSNSGDAVFLTSTLAQGAHNFTAVYDGSANFTPSISAPQLITIGTGSPTNPDFALAATGTTTQTILSGASTSFTFTVQVQNNLSSPITLAATGLPNLATASFNPAYLPPGATPNTFTMTIATPKTTATNVNPRDRLFQPFLATIFLLSPIAGLAFHPRKRGVAIRFFLLTIAGITLLLASGCGDRIKTDPALTSQAKTYAITVTGTATGPTGNALQHSATVTLVLNPAS
ncbi:Ig-like domain repeat protein [Tunturibacter psychrotolerans]|uniref:Ig-like domain repeat protein n=1 Tax=Tunturiibacter psychrotolerans TaxID=3069686 RepID=A0AAU7ZJZ3_9BACT